VILAQAVLLVPVLATSVAYSVFLSTPLGTEPGGEYTHISRTLGGRGVAFVGAWLKIISYVGALAYLGLGAADYAAALWPARSPSAPLRPAIAVASLVFFFAVHAAGVRWFGRIQVAMVAILGLSIAVLVLPGLFAIHPEHYRPFFTHGLHGFAASLPPLFFAYAGFESLAQTAGEVRDSRRRLPGVFLRGLLATGVIYVLMSAVAFGVLPGARLQSSPAPMAEVGAQYLHSAAAWFVTLGAVMALTTSLNATMLVPSRMALLLVRDGLAPGWIGQVSTRTGTPVVGLALTLAGAIVLVLSGQVSLALNIAVFALVLLYLLHSVALVLLPRWNPGLFASVEARVPLWLQRTAAAVSIVSMAGLVALQVAADVAVLRTTTLRERAATHALTTIELSAAWGLLGLCLYVAAARKGHRGA
jgi:basic amino acid/polyamine antiporter, APA family